MTTTDFNIKDLLNRLGIKDINSGVTTGTKWLDVQGAVTTAVSPIDGKEIAKVKNASLKDYEELVKKAQEAFKVWRELPAPSRGEIVRQIGLARLLSKWVKYTKKV